MAIPLSCAFHGCAKEVITGIGAKNGSLFGSILARNDVSSEEFMHHSTGKRF